eukprot:gnl/TRDRNA2_/TRDRNA2_182312_c0_seq1.p1 gnl/TRDRNA2_/TRDRNA2_182312_c0~~gnl/TRDRNA2_/TRDRNA2_182312_c0_seq1.p1  ORF type:complete len:572 (-),score=156.09 gnl/TRDRNA2_/TRDRNA2_182312_c0_seq1:20-1735(-)
MWSRNVACLATAISMWGADAQMFEIPAEMLQGMFGGMGGPQQQQPKTTWPNTENSEISAEYEWLINTEWKGKTAKYLLLRDGIIESPLKECEQEGSCLWAANNGLVLLNTPTLKVLRFTIDGLKQVDRKKIEEKDEAELKKLTLTAEKAGKSGKKSTLQFERLAQAQDDESFISEDLYKILELEDNAEASAIKSKFRRMSITHHPDKGGDPKRFEQIRESYEVLSDPELRKYYDLGGMLLVKNIQRQLQEVEGQKAQLDMQLAKVPENHPHRRQFEAQIEQQKRQFDKARVMHKIMEKMQTEDIFVDVPASALELYNGGTKAFDFKRLMICRGCRGQPDAEHCKDCGRCPPETVQVPQYANTPFGKQVVAVKEREQESRERCREVPVPVADLKIPKGAKDGTVLKKLKGIGHQNPGKLPGTVVLQVSRGDPNDIYSIAEQDLHTTLHISLEQALWGFQLTWKHLDGEKIQVSHDGGVVPNEVVRLPRKGLLREDKQRGDLYVRLVVDLPAVQKGSELTLKAPSGGGDTVKLVREQNVELREGSAWKLWPEHKNATVAEQGKKKGKKDKSDL